MKLITEDQFLAITNLLPTLNAYLVGEGSDDAIGLVLYHYAPSYYSKLRDLRDTLTEITYGTGPYFRDMDDKEYFNEVLTWTSEPDLWPEGVEFVERKR